MIEKDCTHRKVVRTKEGHWKRCTRKNQRHILTERQDDRKKIDR